MVAFAFVLVVGVVLVALLVWRATDHARRLKLAFFELTEEREGEASRLWTISFSAMQALISELQTSDEQPNPPSRADTVLIRRSEAGHWEFSDTTGDAWHALPEQLEPELETRYSRYQQGK